MTKYIAPIIPDTAWIADTATVRGDVTLGEDVSVWFGAVLRGDEAPITVGDRTNVQDGAVLHVSAGFPCIVGADVTIGHGAVVHGCTVEDGALIGIRAVVLDGAVIGAGRWWARARSCRRACACRRGCWLWACRPRSSAR